MFVDDEIWFNRSIDMSNLLWTKQFAFVTTTQGAAPACEEGDADTAGEPRSGQKRSSSGGEEDDALHALGPDSPSLSLAPPRHPFQQMPRLLVASLQRERKQARARLAPVMVGFVSW
jgi:hypothetical protein